MIIDEFGKWHLKKWLQHHAPIDSSQVDDAMRAIVKWLYNNDDDVTERAYDAGWPRVFELACGDKFKR